MAKPRIIVKFPPELRMTATEKASLRSTFKADVIRVLRKRPGEMPPFPETNTNGVVARARKRKAAKKSSKKR
jgi:hypothetical protein